LKYAKNDEIMYPYIAIDFDGTIVEEMFPEIGDIKPHAVRVIKRIKESGRRIAIWTSRDESFYERVKDCLKVNGIPYDAFNEPFPEMKKQYKADSPKIYASLYIDDRAYGIKERNIDWLEVERYIFGG
jgi:predicted mannosyl-3-phosphoglycerate phosphatase (HAD superfamily)